MNVLQRRFSEDELQAAKLARDVLNAEVSDPYAFGLRMDVDGYWRIIPRSLPIPTAHVAEIDPTFGKFISSFRRWMYAP
jgi:hypothetical protein